MRFLVDHQLPPALVDFLRGQACESQHVMECGMSTSSDVEICEFAKAQSWIIVSKDEDFFFLSRRLNSDIRVQQWSNIVRCFEAGDQIVEIR